MPHVKLKQKHPDKVIRNSGNVEPSNQLYVGLCAFAFCIDFCVSSLHSHTHLYGLYRKKCVSIMSDLVSPFTETYRNAIEKTIQNYIETFRCHLAALSLCSTGPSVCVEQQDELFSFRGLLNLCEQRLRWASWWLPLCTAARYWLILIDLYYSCCNA